MNTDSYQENSDGVSKDSTLEIRGRLVKRTVFLVLVVSVWFSEAFLFLMLWSWFLVPLGVPNISYVHAFGIYILWSFIKTPIYKRSRSEELFGLEYWKGYVFHSYIVILIILALAWPTYLILQKQ
jgi:hypothetical protein